MTEEQHARLRALAEAATPGPWQARIDGDAAYVNAWRQDLRLQEGEPTMGVTAMYARRGESPDAEYIAAVSPDVLLALLDALTDAERERDLNHESLALTSEALQEEEDKHDAAEARADALAAELATARQALTQARSDIIDVHGAGFDSSRLELARAATRRIDATLSREGGNGG